MSAQKVAKAPPFLLFVIAGLGSGALAAAWLTGFLESQLFGVTATDPATFASATAVLCLVALVACYGLAHRAAHADPVQTIKAE